MNAPAVLGVVLAGGASRRFGRNKALAMLGGQTLIGRVLARARPQTAHLAIAGFGHGMAGPSVIPDAMPAEGPLTGVVSALRWARSRDYRAIVTFSCDAPFFPGDLVATLWAAMTPEAGCSFACRQGRRHPAFALWPVAAAEAVEAAYAMGERALRGAQDRLGGVPADCPGGDGPGGDAFFNINRPEDLLRAEAWAAMRDEGHAIPSLRP